MLAAVILCGLCPSPAAAQQKDYQEWLREQRKAYKQYLSSQDKAFLKFLKKEWTTVRVDTVAKTPIDDKPRTIPRVDKSRTPRFPDEEAGQAEPPAPERPSAPNKDSTARSTGPSQPSTEPDSLLQTEAGQAPNSMEEAMNQLEAATDEQQSAPEKKPSGKQARKNTPSEKPSAENPNPKTPSPENPQPSGKSAPQKKASETPSSQKPSSKEPTSNLPSSTKKTETAPLSREASLSFFGTSTTVPYGSALTPALREAPSKSSIRRFWKTMAKGPYRPTLKVLQKQRKAMNLSDWGYYLYLQDLSRQLYGRDAPGERALWTWFMMMKSGYAARVGYRQGEVFLMLPVADKIFGRPQMYVGGQRYYLMVDSMSGALNTYEGQHSSADGVLQLDAGPLPSLEGPTKERTMALTVREKQRELTIEYNAATVEYLRAYPNVDLDVLLAAGVSPEARSAFKKAFHPLLKSRSARASLNLLLQFAQFATDYKRDQDHFGEERYLFPEESLATKYSDCEDRAVLLSYLVRTLLDRKVVGLQWPNHVALAVRAGDGLTPAEKDHTVTVDGNTYIYADPTYIGSTLGMKMPIVEDQKPEIITLQ